MAEVRLLAFARTAWDAGQTVLPPYRTRFSKHQFTQPQLLEILCLMPYEDWTFREAEVPLREHFELRQTLGLRCVPDFATLYRFCSVWTSVPWPERWRGPSADCPPQGEEFESGLAWQSMPLAWHRER